MKKVTRMLAIAAASATVIALAACGSTKHSGSTGNANKADLVFWGTDPTKSYKTIITKFEAANPGIHIKFTQMANAEKVQMALANAITAKNGVPDVVMLEDPTVTQFAVSKGLVDLSKFGADKLKKDYSSGPWNKVQLDGKPYALPIDAGPEMFFYNKAIFDKAGVNVNDINTWDDYYQAAKKIRSVGSYITNISGSSLDYQPFTAQIWQAGAQPWKVSGDNITINMTKDNGMQRYMKFMQKMIDENLIDTKISNWSEDWNHALNDGTIASLTIGAWMPVNLINSAPNQAGNWRVRQLPQWKEGENASSEDGGSALAVVALSKQQAAAYKFVEYVTHGDGAKQMVHDGGFPSLKSILNSSSFVDPTSEANVKTNKYFGGQHVNEVLAKAGRATSSSFQYLPYNSYAQQAYGDEISKAYSKQISLEKAMENYAKNLADYGKRQGYNVTLE